MCFQVILSDIDCIRGVLINFSSIVVLPQEFTKEKILQNIIIDDVFGKRVAIYEQIMKGLKELDFLDLVRNNKEILMKFFVFNENEKTTFNDFLVFCFLFFFVVVALFFVICIFQQDRYSLYIPIYSNKSESMTSDFRKIFVWNSTLN